MGPGHLVLGRAGGDQDLANEARAEVAGLHYGLEPDPRRVLIMCGHFALKAPPAKLASYFGLDEVADFAPRYNIPPGTDIPVIRQSPEHRRVLHLLRWGLVPHWSKDPSVGAKLNNARGESVAEQPSFRDAFKRRRCLIPADGFYEWKTEGKIKLPYYISLKSGEPMAMGGLWESWKPPADEIQSLVRPYDAEAMQAWPVDRRVSKAADDDARLIEPV